MSIVIVVVQTSGFILFRFGKALVDNIALHIASFFFVVEGRTLNIFGYLFRHNNQTNLEHIHPTWLLAPQECFVTSLSSFICIFVME